MKVWKDRDGRWIDAKEFVSRWKSGIQKVTPLQQTNSQILFTYIMLVGITCGILVSIWNIKNLWWLGIILLAAFGNTIVSLVGIYQRKFQLEKIKKMILEEHDSQNN